MNVALLFLSPLFLFAEASSTGPAAEGRFPPLKVPPGFRATLFACDPFIEYPSAIAAGPRAGSIFVAVDYMTGLGTEIVRRDEIRLLSDLDGDGYADRSTVYAGGFNSIEGLTFHGGTVFAMHSPFLTALRDTDGDGVADERRDLLEGLGLTPEENPVRLHCANGVAAGHDGWLYLALGDHGCKVRRPEGDRLDLTGGGILRVRPDGRDLHLFARGLRNIYDVALDGELNVFVRDNENDGGEYKVRVCHSFFGADHGYPYFFLERPGEALAPLADLGLGSSAGGVAYLETGFPDEYRGSLFFCEWGRAVMRYRPERAGSGFAPLQEIEFASGAENDPYGFKPTDLAVESDGSLYVADWADGQRPKRGRGRIYRIAWGAGDARPPPAAREISDHEPGEWIARLDSGSRSERIEAQEALAGSGAGGTAALREALRRGSTGRWGRLHAVWVLARSGGERALDELLDLAAKEADPIVRVQAVRAAADLCDPVLLHHRLNAGPGDPALAARLTRLAGLGGAGDSGLLREVLVALGRLRFREAPRWLRDVLGDAPAAMDPALEHAAMQALRRSENWPALLDLLDLPEARPVRRLASRALAERPVSEIVDGLIDRLGREQEPTRRLEYADLLARVAKKPGPQPYWGYRPAPRPPNNVAWERTGKIVAALDRALADPDRAVRFAVLRGMRREAIPAGLEPLSRWLLEDSDPDRAALVLESLRDHPSAQKRATLEAVIGGRKHPAAVRLRALEMFAGELDGDLEGASEGRLLALSADLEDGPVLADALRRAGRRPGLAAAPVIVAKLGSQDPEVRVAALEAAGERRTMEAGEKVLGLLADREAPVRAAAAFAAGRLGLRAAADPLLRLARDPDPAVRRASFESLRLLGEPRAVPLCLEALADRESGPSALGCLGELGSPEMAGAVAEIAKRSPTAEVLPLAERILVRWMERSEPRRPEIERVLAEVQGESGVLLSWRAIGPLSAGTAADAAAGASEDADEGPGAPAKPEGPAAWRTLIAETMDAPLRFGPAEAGPAADANSVWLARSRVSVSEETPVQFLGASSGKLEVRLNGRVVYRRDEARAFRADSDRFEATLGEGANRLVVQVSSPEGPAEFQLRFRRKSSTAEREALIGAALNRSGEAERGRKLFFNAEKLPCSKCHAIRGQGERFGPDLTGIGRRFSRMHLIESILEPGRAIAPSFETTVLVLRDGQVLSGIKVAETAEAVTLGDSQGRRNPIAKSLIADQRLEPLSIMPEGLERQLTAEEFVDLIAFLVGEK